MREVRPADLYGLDFILARLPHVENSAAFGTEHPLMAVGGQSVDLRGFYVDGKRSHALDRVEEVEAAAARADFADLHQVDAVAAQILHEANGQQACARGGFVDLLKIVEDGKPAERDAFGFEPLPREIIGREFFLKRYYYVAGLPSDTGGHDGDALGSVLDDGYFGRLRIEDSRGGIPHALIGRHPVPIVNAAEFESILREASHSLGRPATQRRHGCVVEIQQIFSYRELVAVGLPEGHGIQKGLLVRAGVSACLTLLPR